MTVEGNIKQHDNMISAQSISLNGNAATAVDIAAKGTISLNLGETSAWIGSKNIADARVSVSSGSPSVNPIITKNNKIGAAALYTNPNDGQSTVQDIKDSIGNPITAHARLDKTAIPTTNGGGTSGGGNTSTGGGTVIIVSNDGNGSGLLVDTTNSLHGHVQLVSYDLENQPSAVALAGLAPAAGGDALYFPGETCIKMNCGDVKDMQ